MNIVKLCVLKFYVLSGLQLSPTSLSHRARRGEGGDGGWSSIRRPCEASGQELFFDLTDMEEDAEFWSVAFLITEVIKTKFHWGKDTTTMCINSCHMQFLSPPSVNINADTKTVCTWLLPYFSPENCQTLKQVYWGWTQNQKMLAMRPKYELKEAKILLKKNLTEQLRLSLLTFHLAVQSKCYLLHISRFTSNCKKSSVRR